eukprot:TRINITY_DN3557_c0_g2_i5.p1 TRINITY_DN3557_c0_g2~~TRINITY_DN3557_c0_g2_i5.p1  ORF type:complete len:297 (+),score=119.74 TRINITY_DN3557_c0_g2_i5:514-1404(+)
MIRWVEVEHEEDLDQSNPDTITETELRGNLNEAQSESAEQISNVDFEEAKEEKKCLDAKADAVQDVEYKEEIIIDPDNIVLSEHSHNSQANGGEDNFEALEEAVKLYDDYRTLSKAVDPGNDKALEDEFVQQLTELANALKRDLENVEASGAKRARILQARNDITNITFEKMIKMTKDRKAAEIWRNIQKEQNSIVNELISLVDKENSGGSPKDVSEEAKRQIGENLKKQFEKEKKELLDRISSLEKENTRYLNNIIKHSKTAATSNHPATKELPTRAEPAPRNTKKFTVLLRVSI